MKVNAEQRLSSYDVNVESRRIIDNAMQWARDANR